MSTAAPTRTLISDGHRGPSLQLMLIVKDPNTVTYLSGFDALETRAEKALEALKVGVIAIQSASPTLDTRVVQAKFSELEGKMREYVSEFQTGVKDELTRYFKDKDGVVPRSIDGALGENGSLLRTFQTYFDPHDGRVCRLMQAQVGPESVFGRALDPRNKEGILASIEARVQSLVESKLDEVLKQFSLDADGSSMCRLKTMLSDSFERLNLALAVKSATAEEARKGHVKGIEFEQDLYTVFAETGRQLGDETELVRGSKGADGRSKKGDFVATLGESSGAPGARIAVEVKDQQVRLKAAIEELQEAKANREASVGIFVFARGTEPNEVGDFRRIGEDFYCAVDLADLEAGKPLLFFDSAYRIARAMVVASARKEAAGEVDFHKIQDQVDALAAWSDRIADMATKARTIQNSGRVIEQCANDLKADLDQRVAAVLEVIRRCGAK
jgi:hypothetical protein